MTTRMLWRLAWWLAFAVLYGFTAQFSDWLVFPGDVIASLWIPAGFALAVSLLWGWQLWPGVLLGASGFYVLQGVSFPIAGFFAAAETVEVLLVVIFTRRLLGPKLNLGGPLARLKFLLAVFLACAMMTALLFVGPLSTGGIATAWAWWLARVNSMILLAPLGMSLGRLPQKSLHRKMLPEIVLLLVGVVVGTVGIFGNWLPRELSASLPYLLLLFLFWPALRFNAAMLSITAVLIFSIALTSTRLGYGPFALMGGDNRLLSVQLFGLIVGMLSLFWQMPVAEQVAGEPVGVASRPQEDATNTHRLLDQLSVSEARWRAILENAPMTITMTDLDGKILALSRSFSPDKQVEELIGESFYAYLPFENQARVHDVTATVIQKCQPTYFEMAFLRPDGGREWVSNHVVPVIQDGNAIALIYLATDITERKIAEQATRANEKRLRAIIDAAPFGAHSYELFADGQLVFSSYNLAADQILGFAHASIVGKSLEDAFPGVVGTPIPDIYRRVAADGERYHDEQVAYHEGQIQGVFEVHAFQTNPHHMTVFFRDITEHKKAAERIRQMTEELEQRVRQRTAELEATNRQLETINLELESLSYTVSHDLRSPLRAIDGFSHILMDEYGSALPDDALRRMKAIRSNAQQMGQLIDDLLTFVHLGRQSLAFRQVNMRALVEQTLIALEDELSTRQIEIVIGQLPVCTGDPSLLRQVWLNLISNAVKFTRQNQMAKVEITSEQRDGETVYLVRDNGTGFSMQYADKLFGMFQRLHVQEQYEGTGVGLAIVERIIRKHGGRVWAEAQPDEGATFYFVVS